MRILHLVVFYLWTNICTVNTGILTRPFISIYQRKPSRHSLSWDNLLRPYSKGSERKDFSTNNQFSKYTKSKRFFEFNPLAFDRQLFKTPGNKPFRTFDSKRFFQYSPFIARLQRSKEHIAPKIISPKTYHKPVVYKPVADYFAGFNRWTPLTKNTVETDRFPNSANSQNEHSEIKNNKDLFSDTGLQRPEFGKLHDPQSTFGSGNIFNDDTKTMSEEQYVTHNMNDNQYKTKSSLPVKDNGDIPVSFSQSSWGSGTIPYQNFSSSFPEVVENEQTDHVLDKIEDHPYSENKAHSNFLWNANDGEGKDNVHINKNRLGEKPILFGQLSYGTELHQNQPVLSSDKEHLTGDVLSDADSYSKNNGFGSLHSSGSFGDTLSTANSGLGYSNTLQDTPALHSVSQSHNQGVWGSFAASDGTGWAGSVADSIPVPPLEPLSNNNEECMNIERSLCAADSDCGCFGLFICLRNVCTSVIVDEEEILPSAGFWHDEPVDFPERK